MPMTNDYNSLTALINAFRKISAHDAISPDSLGALLQKITTFANELYTQPIIDATGTYNLGIFNSEAEGDAAAAVNEVINTRYKILLYEFRAEPTAAWQHRVIIHARNENEAMQFKFSRSGLYTRVIEHLGWELPQVGAWSDDIVASVKSLLQQISSKANSADIPKPQSGRSATAVSKQYIFSTENPESKCSVLNAPDTYVRRKDGHLWMQKGLWNPTGESVFYTRHQIPVADSSCDGPMSKEVFGRLGTSASIYESTASATDVTVSYPNWASGGNRTFKLGAATSARAGVLTSALFSKLNNMPAAAALNQLVNSGVVHFFDGIVSGPISLTQSGINSEDTEIIFSLNKKCFVARLDDKYYASWPEQYGIASPTPNVGHIYVCASDVYTWDGEDLVRLSSNIGEELIGAANGIAPLDELGHIPEKNLPTLLGTIMDCGMAHRFDAVVDGFVTISTGGTSFASRQIVFVSRQNKFAARVINTAAGTGSYFASWPAAEGYVNEQTPRQGHIYICGSDIYMWTGSQMALLIADANAKIGAANGIAPLDANAKLPSAYLPPLGLLPFHDMISEEVTLSNSAPSDSVEIVYNSAMGCFMGRSGSTYYPTFNIDNFYGTPTDNGVIPVNGVIYLCTATGWCFIVAPGTESTLRRAAYFPAFKA